jgi:hypothetical protein
MPRFVILYHEMPAGAPRASHWDLMLDRGETLATWALDEPLVPEHEVAAQQLADHRRDYLDYEGPVSGNRGHVTRWDAGTFTGELSADKIAVALHGVRCHGTLKLSRETSSDPRRWRVYLDPAEGTA